MKQTEIEVEKNKEEIQKIILSIIDKGANYVIKGMPVNKHIKEVLIEIKKVLSERDFSQILNVAITSSIKEGMEIMGIKSKNMTEINNMVDTAFKGGLSNCINLGIDIIGNTKKCGNIFFNYIDDFFMGLKSFVSSTEFKKKIYANLEKCLDKVDDFKELCNDWYDAYDNFNVDELKNIAGKLNKLKSKVSFNNDCMNENNIIQNVTELVNRKKQKLTKIQFDICSNFEKV